VAEDLVAPLHLCDADRREDVAEAVVGGVRLDEPVAALVVTEAEVLDRPHVPLERVVVRRDDAALAGRQDLPGVEAEDASVELGTGGAVATTAPEGPGGVLDDHEVVRFGDVVDRPCVERHAKQRNGEDRGRVFGDGRLDRVWVDVVGVPLDVDEDGRGAEADDHVRGRWVSERGDDHLVALADIGGVESEFEARRTGGDRDRVVDADHVGDVVLELLGEGALGHPAGREDLLDVAEFVLAHDRLDEGDPFHVCGSAGAHKNTAFAPAPGPNFPDGGPVLPARRHA